MNDICSSWMRKYEKDRKRRPGDGAGVARNERREMGRAHDCENLGFCLPSA
jgi:hypothetical protein